MFLSFMQKFKMVSKSGRKTILAKNSPVVSAATLSVNNFVKRSPVESSYAMWVKIFIEIAPALTVSEINELFAFYPEIKFGRQKWWANNFIENSPVDSAYTLQFSLKSL